MKRIATVNREIDKFGPGKDGFRSAQPGVSEPTYLSADFFNGVQESLVRVIEAADLVPNADYDQFLTALNVIIFGSDTVDGVLGEAVSTVLKKLNGVEPDQGSALVMYTASSPGAVPRALVKRLSDTVSILDFGGADDGATNNLAAFHAALAHLNQRGGGVLRLPKVKTGDYFVSGADTMTVDFPVDIDADPGVSITMMYGGGVHMLTSSNLRARRELARKFQNFGFTTFFDAMKGKRLGETLPTANNSDGVLAIPRVLSGTAFRVYRLVDMLNDIAPVSAVGDSITYAGAGQETMAVVGAMPNKTVHALLSADGGGKFTVGVLTVAGFAYYEMNSADGAITFNEQETGLPPIFAGVNNHLMGAFRDYFNNGLLAVRVNSLRSFTVMVNGLAIGTANTRSAITAVGFGTTDVATNVALSQMFETVGNGRAGSKPLRLIVCGDSISDETVQYPHAKYLPLVLGTAGVQVEQVINLARAGEAAAQQYARLQTVGAGADYCLIQVGVNDIQGITDVGAFISTISNMVTYARNIGAVPIVAMPTGFYSLAEANAHGQTGGQDTANNSQMRTYRSVLARAVAAAGGLLNMETLTGFGPITAGLLDVASYAANDRMLVDNIHPTPYASMMLAQGWARCILGHINQPDVSTFSDFEPINGIWLASGYGAVQAPTIQGRNLRGALSLHASNPNEGATAMTLPAYLTDGTAQTLPVVCIDAAGNPIGVCSMIVSTSGSVKFFNLPAGAKTVMLDGIRL